MIEQPTFNPMYRDGSTGGAALRLDGRPARRRGASATRAIGTFRQELDSVSSGPAAPAGV